MFISSLRRLTGSFPRRRRTVSNQRVYHPPRLEPLEDRSVPAAPVAGSLSAPFVSQLYRDLLHREVDAPGLAAATALLDSGQVTRTQLVQSIETSPEYRTARVNAIYFALLQRSADPAGLSNSLAFLNAGGTPEQLTGMVAGSPEYLQTKGNGTNAGFLDALYRDLLGRTGTRDCSHDFNPSTCIISNRLAGRADPEAQAALVPAMDAGLSRTQVAAMILGSDEYLQKEVQNLYGIYLHRTPDAAGQAAFVTYLHQGATAEMATALLAGSDEYLMKVPPSS
jgi:hypothetical protein